MAGCIFISLPAPNFFYRTAIHDEVVRHHHTLNVRCIQVNGVYRIVLSRADCICSRKMIAPQALSGDESQEHSNEASTNHCAHACTMVMYRKGPFTICAGRGAILEISFLSSAKTHWG